MSNEELMSWNSCDCLLVLYVYFIFFSYITLSVGLLHFFVTCFLIIHACLSIWCSFLRRNTSSHVDPLQFAYTNNQTTDGLCGSDLVYNYQYWYKWCTTRVCTLSFSILITYKQLYADNTTIVGLIERTHTRQSILCPRAFGEGGNHSWVQLWGNQT